MAYCTLANIASGFQRITFDATSQPTIVEVETFCDEISAEMDAFFQTQGITVPVTGAAPLLVLRNVAINGVLAKVLRSIETEIDVAVMYQGLYDKAMKNIMARPEVLGTAITEDAPSHQGDMQTRKYEMGETNW